MATPRDCPNTRMKEKNAAAWPASSGRPAAWMASAIAGKSIPVPIETVMFRKTHCAIVELGESRIRRPEPSVVSIQPIQRAHRYRPVLAQRMPTTTDIAVKFLAGVE